MNRHKHYQPRDVLEAAITKGLSLHIGLNRVDPNHYDGWDGALSGCINDAKSMIEIAKQNGFASTSLIDGKATKRAVLTAITSAAKQLTAGGFFFLTYSGHGGQVPDVTNDEEDHKDETWCLFDGELIDDELALAFSKFQKGVRILVVSDSCHSGTVTRDRETSREVHRAMPDAKVMSVYLKNKDYYDDLQRSLPKGEIVVSARVRLLSGCQDNQTSADGDVNGLFTEKLLQVFKSAKFPTMNYSRFMTEVVKKMPRNQTPNHYVYGGVDQEYDALLPFSMSARPQSRNSRPNQRLRSFL